MAIAFVSATNGEDITGSNVTTVATSDTMNVAAGALLVAGVKYNSGVSVASITDGGSNSFTYAGATGTNASSAQEIQIWYKQNASANATATFAATTGSASYPGIVVMQFSGVATASALDTTTSNSADANFTVTSGSFTPAQTNEVVVAMAQDNGNGGVWTEDTAKGYSTDANAVSGTAHEVFGQYNITVAASAQTVAAVNDFTSYKSIAVATFKEAGGGGGAGNGGFRSLLGVGR
jgi:hypothetical protein